MKVAARRRNTCIAAAAMLLAAATAACANSNASSNTNANNRTLRVLAASSLTEAFTQLGHMFEASHKGVTVTFAFGASSALAEQIEQGAPADAFASADEDNLAKAVGPDQAKVASAVFARNRLAIVVAAGNPKAVDGLRALAEPGLVIALCAPEVPCGSLAAAALAKTNVTVKPASLEQNVKAVLTKVALGEADAGIVYETDVKAAGGKVAPVPVENASEPDLQAAYAMLPTNHSAHPAESRQWVAFVRSPEAQAELAKFGFLPA